MEFKDYYKILGVEENATAAEIKKSYRKLARKYHPDVNAAKDSEANFKEVNEAYQVVSDAEKRAEYDQLKKYGAAGADGSFQAPPGWESAANYSQGGFNDFNMGGKGGFSDFFESIFGRGAGASPGASAQGRQQSFALRGEDIHIKVPLFLEEAYKGAERTLEYYVPVMDEYGLATHRKKKLKVKIPLGSSADHPIRLKGQGGIGVGGAPAGDLFIDIEIAPHPLFTVKGKDLYQKVPITPWETALGTTIKVKTLDGLVNLKIPADSQAGNRLRLKQKGLPGGDMFVELQIVMPPTNSAKAKKLYEEIAKESAFNPRETEEVAV